LIGGATTSAKHTAVKIAPTYSSEVIHVLDASRSVGVVEKLINADVRPQLAAENRALQKQLVASHERRQEARLVPYAEALEKRFATDWTTIDIPQPEFTGARTINDVPLAELRNYIDWSPFFLTWELKGKYPRILDDPQLGDAAQKLFADANNLLDRIISGRLAATRSAGAAERAGFSKPSLLTAHGVYGFWPAASQGDDIIVFEDEQRTHEMCRFHALRQQWERKGQEAFCSLADFIAPIDSGRHDYIGAFAVTAGIGCDEIAAHFDREHDDYNSIMTKALADRLAEAFAEWLHERVRREWGYGKAENLTNEELIDEKYRGIRPAPGYPSQPDHTEKRNLFRLLDAERHTGIRLTESYAMHPAASVCGLYFAHPHSRYFAVDRITRDQVEDYSRRKAMPAAEVERWLAPNLGYEPG
jgi:5-methyltetrahydrofolate--homocysteine methyltransferase